MPGPVSPDQITRKAEVAQVAFGNSEKNGNKRIDAIKEKFAASKEARPFKRLRPAILETLNPPIKVDGIFLKQNFGTEIDPNTGQIMPDAESQARRNTTVAGIDLARKALNYDKLTNGEKQAIIIHAERILTADPNILATLPPPGWDRDAWIESQYLSDPRILAKIQEKISALEAERLPDATEITQRDMEVDQATAEHTRADTKRKGLDSELRRIRNRQREFESNGPADNQLKNFESTHPAYTRQQLDRIEIRINALTAQLGGRRTTQEIAYINQQIDNLEIQAGPMRTYEALKTEKERLPQDEIKTDGELTAVTAETKVALNKQLIAKANLNQAKISRAEAEQALVNKANNLIIDSIREVMSEDYDRAESVYQEEIDKFVASSKDMADKIIGKQLTGRYVKEKTPGRIDRLRGVTKYESNIVLATSDFNIVLTDPINGPKILAERVLRDGFKTEIESGNMTQDEVNEIVTARMKDAEWVENMSARVGGNMLREIRKNRPFFEAETKLIAKTKLGEKMLKESMSAPPAENPPEVNAVIEELKEKGMVNPDNMDDKSKNWLLNIILMGVGFVKSLNVPTQQISQQMSQSWQENSNDNFPLGN